MSTCKITTSDGLLTLPVVLVSPMTFVVRCFTPSGTSKNFKFNKSHHKPAETFRKTKTLNVTGLIVNAKEDTQRTVQLYRMSELWVHQISQEQLFPERDD